MKEYEIMEADEAEALKLHLFSSTWSFKWLKQNNYISKWLHGEAADVDLIKNPNLGVVKVLSTVDYFLFFENFRISQSDQRNFD